MLKESPPGLYSNILPFGGSAPDGRSATIGGTWHQPNLGLSFLLAARDTIERGVARQRLNEVAIPAAFLQRHAVEVELKAILEAMYSIKSDIALLDALHQNSSAKRPAGMPLLAPRDHDLVNLVTLVREELEAIELPLPIEVADAAHQLHELERKHLSEAARTNYSRFRYQHGGNGTLNFPKEERLSTCETQEQLELVFHTHLTFRDEADQNFRTVLSFTAVHYFQRIQEVIPPSRFEVVY